MGWLSPVEGLPSKDQLVIFIDTDFHMFVGKCNEQLKLFIPMNREDRSVAKYNEVIVWTSIE